MILISEDQILSMHHRLIELYGGQDGLRDESMLESALSVPFQSFQGQDFYPGITAKAARLCYGLVMDHPFLDGNKRNRRARHACSFGTERHFFGL